MTTYVEYFKRFKSLNPLNSIFNNILLIGSKFNICNLKSLCIPIFNLLKFLCSFTHILCAIHIQVKHENFLGNKPIWTNKIFFSKLLKFLNLIKYLIVMNYKSYELIEIKNKNGDNKIIMKQKMCNYNMYKIIRCFMWLETP